MRISAVWYPISQWDEARHFYGRVLGLRETQVNDDAGWAAYATGGPALFLIRRPELAGLPGGAVVSFLTDDIETLRDAVAGAGCRVDDAIQVAGNLLIMTFYDPDGNRLEATQIWQQ